MVPRRSKRPFFDQNSKPGQPEVSNMQQSWHQWGTCGQKHTTIAPKSDQNLWEFDLRVPRGHVCSQVAPKTRRLKKSTAPLTTIWAESGFPRKPRNPENCSKTDLLPLDGRLGPPKMTSASSSGNNVKNDWILDLNM